MLPASVAVGQLAPQPSVDPFTGAFQCSIPLLTIPGPHGGGYTVSMSYTSDVTAEQEASWVGYGWSLEPPRIVRQKRGFPDDIHKRSVTFEEKGKITTTTVTLSGNHEILAINISDDGKSSLGSISLGGALSLEWNSLTGFDVSFATLLSAGMGLTDFAGFGVGLSMDTKGRYGLGFGVGYNGKGLGCGLGVGTPVISYDPSTRQRPTVGAMRPLGTSTSKTYEGTLRMTGAPLEGWEAGAALALSEISFGSRDINVSGYMYSPLVSGQATESGVMIDYLTDRERAVTSKDRDPLPMALPGQDEFFVSAPGISGRFRAHHALPMAARPPEVTSAINIESYSLKVILGSSIGGGVGAAFPIPSKYQMASGENTDALTSDLENDVKIWNQRSVPFFRFIDDPAQPITYTESRSPLAMNLSGLPRVSYHPVGGQGATPRMNRSIRYRTSKEVKDLVERVPSLTTWLYTRHNIGYDAIHPPLDETISEFSITDEGGSQYEFGAPSYSTFESTTRVVAKGNTFSGYNSNNSRVVYGNSSSGIGRVDLRNGEEGSAQTSKIKYATSWGISAIYGPNYVDIGDNGPDAADIGSWTKFSYINDVEREWRSPYTGYWLERGVPGPKEDDVLIRSTGKSLEKILRKIETETHVAYFFTSQFPTFRSEEISNGEAPSSISNEPVYSYSSRQDHLNSFDDRPESIALPSPRTVAVPTNTRPYLARIELWLKAPNGQCKTKLKTIHFVYDYSVCPGNPSSAVSSTTGQNLGKLTLRRIWEEERNVSEPTIQPLDFFYEYPNYGAAATSTKDGIAIGVLSTRYPGTFSSPVSGAENPVYDAEEVDAWGYQSGVRPYLAAASTGNDQVQRFGTPQPWQAVTRDPAAWKLKTIRLPSGARIIPQYERRTYSWVQDKQAMTLSPLTAESRDFTTTPAGNWYYVSLADVGITTSTPAAATTAYFEALKARFLDAGEPMYFKFAHSVEKCDAADGSDISYSRGYAAVTECELVSTGGVPKIRVKLGTMQPIGNHSADDIESNQKTGPFYAAYKTWKTFRKGACEPAIVNPIDAISRITDNTQIWKWNKSSSIPLSVLPILAATKSQVRLPVFGVKYGGGARVKRLLNISPSGTLESNDEAAIGTEYVYGEQDINGNETKSWGVATDEPMLIREENPIVGIDRQHWVLARTHILDEEDMATKENPLAATLLPAPSIGYSQVVARSINRQENTPGYSVSRFLTVKDVPSVRVEKTAAQVLSDEYDTSPYLMFMKSKLKLDIVQSYAISTADYHGLPLSVEKFAGVHGIGNNSLVASTRYEYLMPKDTIFLYKGLDSTMRARINIDATDIVAETRRYTERLNTTRTDFSLEFNGFPFPGFGFINSDINHVVRLSTSSNITRYTPRLARTISMNEGRTDTSRIVAWDYQTGLPAVVEGYDAYHHTNATGSLPGGNHNGAIASISDPLHLRYPELGQQSTSYRATFGQGRVVAGIGATNAALVGGNLVVNRTAVTAVNPYGSPSEHIPNHNLERNELLASHFSVGDVLHVKTGSALSAVVEVVSVTVTTPGMLSLSFRTVGGTVPTSGFTLELHRSGRRNYIGPSSESRLVYGANFDVARTKAKSLLELENGWITFLNTSARLRTGGLNFSFFMNDGLYPPDPDYKFWFEFRRGSLTPFLPNQSMVTDLETLTTGCVVTSPPQSKYTFALHRAFPAPGVASEEVRLGILKPYGAVGCAISNSNGVCGYNWNESPGVSNSCWENAWTLFDGSTTEHVADQYQWDEWMRFAIGDGKHVFVTSAPEKTRRLNTGALHIRGTLGEPSQGPLPADARFLSHGTSMWAGFTKTVGSRSYVQWTPVTQWSWQSNVKPSTSAVAGRVFEAAGTFARTTAPSTNWTPAATETSPVPTPTPSPSTTGGWHRGSLVLDVDKHGRPTTIVDNQGNKSVVQYSTTGYSPEAAFANATPGLCWFENFEDATTSGNSNVFKFTGQRSRLIASTSTANIDRPSRAVASTSSTAEPTVIRLWLLPADVTHVVDGNVSIQGTVVAPDDILASVDGWRLIEVQRTIAPTTTSISINTFGMACAVYVDDIIVHQRTGSTSATVIDEEHRPIASFNSDHFPSRVGYDAKGRVAVQHTLMSSGLVASVATSGNLPRKPRPTGGGGAFATGATMLLLAPIESLPGFNELDEKSSEIQETLKKLLPEPNGIKAKGSLLDIEASPDGMNVSPFLGPSLDLPALKPAPKDTTTKKKELK